MPEPAAAGASSGPEPVRASTSPGRLTVEFGGDLGLRPDDTAAHDALIAGRPQTGVFLSNAWLSGLFAEPPAGFEPSLVVLREAGTLRGMVPIAIRETRTCVRVAMLGGGLGSDRVDLLAARGFEPACADAFLSWVTEWLGARGFVLELRDVPGESPLWGAIHRAGAERQPPLVLEPREIHALPYLDLAEDRSLANGATSPVPGPGSLNKHRRWLERRGRLRIETLQGADEVMAAFESLVQLLHARWGLRGGWSALDEGRAQRFHRHVLPLLLRAGHLRMIRLSADSRTIAVYYGLASGRWWGYYLAGYDREWAGRIHLGQVALAAAIDLASQEGATEFDFLKGAERVKYLWPVRERVTVDADVYSARSAAQFQRATRAGRNMAVALAKSAHGLFSTR